MSCHESTASLRPGNRSVSKTSCRSRYRDSNRSGARWKSPSVSLLSTNKGPILISISVRSVRPLATGMAARNPNSGSEAWRNTQQCAQRRPYEPPRVTKDVHQQRVGAGGAVQFEASSILRSRHKSAGGIAFRQAFPPGRIAADPSPGRRQKVAVTLFPLFKDDACGRPPGDFVAVSLSTNLIAGADFSPQFGRAQRFHHSRLHSILCPLKATCFDACSQDYYFDTTWQSWGNRRRTCR